MNFVAEEAWEPIQLDVRLASQAKMAFLNPNRLVELRAQRGTALSFCI
jgi:hypothetical protein